MRADMIVNLLSIDGALMLDLKGICYEISVIVDGISKTRGNPERGARFNSSNDYVNNTNKNNKHKCMAIIIPEDKSIDIFN